MRVRRWSPAVVVSCVLALVTIWLALGCEAVPDIHFVSDDASSDAGGRDADATTDGGADTGADAGLRCSGSAPGAAATCCGTVWCLEDCSPANCARCEQKGCPGELCCGKAGNVLCKPSCP